MYNLTKFLPFLVHLQSGQIHFYNTRTQKRTSRDPRSPEPATPDHDDHEHMSLDLQLTLPCESLRKSHADDNFTKPTSGRPARVSNDHDHDMSMEFRRQKKNSRGSGGGGTTMRSPSWLTLEEDRQEMVATVCTHCHMLVMLCKSSPACPNCKFVHPPDQSPPTLFKRRCTTLLC